MTRQEPRPRQAPPADPEAALGPELCLGPPARHFWIITGIALLIRAVYLAQASSVPLFDRLIMDGAVYDAWARQIASGDWIGTEVFYQAPLYPYLLGVLKTLGADGLWPIRIVQILLGSLSCGFLYLAGRDVFSARIGWIAGLGLALYAPAIFFDGIIQKASLGGFLVTLLLWLAVRASRQPRPAGWFGVGCVLGLLMMTREETLLLAPIILAWILVHVRPRTWRDRLSCAGSYVGGAALVLFPVALRNAHVGGEFVLTTSQAGSNFFIGNHAGANGTYTPLRPGRSNTPLERVDARELAELGAGRKLTASEVSAYWFRQSFGWIREHPLDWVKLLLRKAKLLINANEIADSEDQDYYAEHSWLLRWLGHVLHLGVVLPLAAVGIWVSRSQRGTMRLILALFATLCLGVIAFYVFARYRYPIVPFAILFGSLGAVHVVDLCRERRYGALAVPGLICALVAFLANLPGLGQRAQLAMAYSNAGAALLDAGQARAAEAEIRHSLELDDDADSWSNLGRALAAQQRIPEGIEAIQKALAKRPADPRFLLDLARLTAAHGDVDRAIELTHQSLSNWPKDPNAWAFLGSLHAQQQAWLEVADVARRAHVANPDDLSTALSLAWVLATAPDPRARQPAEAVRIAELARERTGGKDFRSLDVLGVAYASAGRFDEAAVQAAAAARIAEQVGESSFAAQIRQRLEQFRRKTPVAR